MPTILPPALIGAGLAAALVAGVFLSFSDFVMRSLGKAAPAAGAEAMQQINREVFRSGFMALLIGSAPLALVALALAAWVVEGAAASWLTAGAASYLLGVMAVTRFGNVPMNERLEGMGHGTQAAQSYWAVYSARWTRWNHLRSAAALITAICYLAAALDLAQSP